jgi:ribosome-associated translation inhibitor RaiA
MQIQINSGNTVPMHARLSGLIEANIHRILNRFETQLTRVEVHLNDENGDKSGPQAKRCTLEVRPRHYPSLTVTNDAPDIETSVSGAAAKMQRLLETTFGRLHDQHKRQSPRLAGDFATPLLAE